MDLNELPLTKNKFRDDLSACIFLSYAAHVTPKAKRKLTSLLKAEIVENQLAYPVQKEFAERLFDQNIKVRSLFEPEESCSSIHGLTAAIIRVLHTPLNHTQVRKIESLLVRLEKISFRQEDRIFWLNYLKIPQVENPVGVIGLSLHRGLGGIIATLSVCYQQGIDPERCIRLLEGAINQILYIDASLGSVELPGYWGSSLIKNLKRTTPSYGDVAVGYAITLAGMRCKNKKWVKEGKRLLRRGIARTPKAAGITDPYFGEGASGLSHLAFRYYQITKDDSIFSHIGRWMKYADSLYEKKFKNFEKNVEADSYIRMMRKAGRAGPAVPASLHNSSLGYILCKWHQEGLIDAQWDSMYGISNPVTGKTL